MIWFLFVENRTQDPGMEISPLKPVNEKTSFPFSKSHQGVRGECDQRFSVQDLPGCSLEKKWSHFDF